MARAEAIQGAVDWLLSHQNADGSWGSHHSPRPIEVMSSVPGGHEAFRVATTALCVEALLETAPGRNAEVHAAASRGLDHLLRYHDVKRPRGIEFYCTWSFAYGLQALAAWLEREPDDPRSAEIRKASARLVEKIADYQSPDGGFGYLDFGARTHPPAWTTMSFTTATVIVALCRAREVDVDVPPGLLDRAVANLQRSRTLEGSFTYDARIRIMPRVLINRPAGSACRTPSCHLALHLADHSLRRPIPHESWYQISGYFYLYGHYNSAILLSTLTHAEQQRLWPHLESAILLCREPDDSFWDYPLYSYHKPYGTAYALLALLCAPPRSVPTATRSR